MEGQIVVIADLLFPEVGALWMGDLVRCTAAVGGFNH